MKCKMCFIDKVQQCKQNTDSNRMVDAISCGSIAGKNVPVGETHAHVGLSPRVAVDNTKSQFSVDADVVLRGCCVGRSKTIRNSFMAVVKRGTWGSG